MLRKMLDNAGKFNQGALTKREGSVQLTSLYITDAFCFERIFYFYDKQATLLTRSTVPILPLQLVFHGLIKDNRSSLLGFFAGDEEKKRLTTMTP
jgi:hypothetical protein